VQGWDLVEKKARKGTLSTAARTTQVQVHGGPQPIDEKCPKLRPRILVEKNLKAGPVIACPNKECDYERPAPPAQAAEAGA